MPASIEISRPLAGEHAGYYDGYVACVPGQDARAELASQVGMARDMLGSLSVAGASHRYAPGKWSVKEVVGHLCDSERIFGYRALRFARNDPTPLPGFEEDLYVPAGRFAARSMGDLLNEWCAVRSATLALFGGLDAEALLCRGTANGSLMSVRALAWVTAGHTLHHVGVLRERYGIRSA